MKLLCVIAFHYVENRLENFYKTYNKLSKIPNISIIVDSNVKFDTNIHINSYELENPYFLTWQHKNYMPAFHKTDFTHFAYIEGNLDVSESIFNYWNKTNELFKRNKLNFIPAIHRVQLDENGVMYSLDSTHKPRNRSIIEVEGKKFISPSEPYQGMFIMDRNMVEEHIHSKYFEAGQKGWFGMRESANLGNIYVNTPVGYEHRSMLPLNNLLECCVVHYGTDYRNDPISPHAKIKVSELFDAC